MENMIETLTEQDERVLIHTNDSEINRITHESQSRCNILNKLLQAGLTNDEITLITSSTSGIENHVLKLQLQQNKTLAKMIKDGIVGAKASLPPELTDLKYTLTAWLNYRGAVGSKFQFIDFTNQQWHIDAEKLENYFVDKQYKIYVLGEQLTELKTLLAFGEYLDTTAESGQVFASQFLSQRYTCDSLQACNVLPKKKFMVKYSYFRNETV